MIAESKMAVSRRPFIFQHPALPLFYLNRFLLFPLRDIPDNYLDTPVALPALVRLVIAYRVVLPKSPDNDPGFVDTAGDQGIGYRLCPCFRQAFVDGDAAAIICISIDIEV